MSTWITIAELDQAFGSEEIVRLADLDQDGAPDAHVIDKAIADAVERIRSRLSVRYRAVDLEFRAGVPGVLRRLTTDLAFFQLHKRWGDIPPHIVSLRDNAEAEVEQIVSGGASLGLEGEPPVDNAQALILTSPSRTDRLTLSVLED